MRAILYLVLVSALVSEAFAALPPPPYTGFHKGVGLGLFAENEDFDYKPLIDEIVDLNANCLAVYIVYFQENATSSRIYAKTGRTAPQHVIKEVLDYAGYHGLEVMMVPIILLENPHDGEWRGNIDPNDPDQWWKDYSAMIDEITYYRGHFDYLSIGSELSSMEEGFSLEWCKIIESLQQNRIFYKLLYTANWDQIDKFPHWDQMDAMGISGYYELINWEMEPEGWEPNLEELETGWEKWKDHIKNVRERMGLDDLPLLFTELGYPSHRHGARYPWNYTLKQPVDLKQQKLCYEAFIAVWAEEMEGPFQGVYWYNYFEEGGPGDTGYTPRGKPAANVVKSWYKELDLDAGKCWEYKPPTGRYDDCRGGSLRFEKHLLPIEQEKKSDD